MYLFAQTDKIEYFFDVDPGYGLGKEIGPALLTQADDNKIMEAVSLNIPVNGLQDGFHNLYVRAHAKKGWSQTQFIPFVKMTLPGEDSAQVDYIEYFYDEDPGYKSGHSLDMSGATNGTYTFNADLKGFSDGFHTLYVRSLNKYGRWSQVMTHPFYKTTLPGEFSKEIIYTEYYFDSDPGKGKGVSFPYSSDQLTINFNAALNGLSLGNHTIYLRGQYKNNIWEKIGEHSFTLIEGTGIDSPESDIFVYPNPVKEWLFIKNDKLNVTGIELINNNGQVLYSVNPSEQAIIQISFNSYPQGMYFIKIHTGDGKVKTHKLIKQ